MRRSEEPNDRGLRHCFKQMISRIVCNEEMSILAQLDGRTMTVSDYLLDCCDERSMYHE